MPHIIISYRRKNALYGLDYALHINYIYALAFLIGFSAGIFILIREKRRLNELALREKEKIGKFRGGSDEDYPTNLMKYLYAVAYVEFLSNPIICIEPGHYEVVDPKILPILLSILGYNVVGPNGIYEPRVITPGLWIMACIVHKLKNPTVIKKGKEAALEVLKFTLQEDFAQMSLKSKAMIAIEQGGYILRSWKVQLKYSVSLVVISNILSRITVRLTPDAILLVLIWNTLRLLAVGLGVAAAVFAGISFNIAMLQPVMVQLLSISLGSTLLLTSTKSIVCNRMLQALPSNSTHVEYLMPVPTTEPRNDRVALKDKIIMHAKKRDDPEKILYINVPEKQDMLCEKREFAKTLEGKILEASDLTDQASIPTYIQEDCTKIPGTSIPVTQTIKTRSDVEQHDERPVREETDRGLTLLEMKDILEDGNWYGAEKQLTPVKVNDQPPTTTKPVPRLRGSNPSRRKQTMTVRDLPKDDPEETCFVQEDTQRVSKLAEKAEKISHQDNYDDDHLI